MSSFSRGQSGIMAQTPREAWRIASYISAMAESTTIATLKRKRDEIARSILAYEKKLDQARADLAHINAAISIFAASGERQVLPP